MTALAAAPPSVKGWCPGAHRPMASGDGLIVRVGAPMGRLTRDQVLGLCDLAAEFGNGVLDLTSRANLQIRGVTESGHPALIEALVALGLIDSDPMAERRPAVTATPLWHDGDRTCRLAVRLMARLPDFPALPAKFGIALDAGPAPVLTAVSADIRVEGAADGGLTVRADGAPSGTAVTEADAVETVLDLARWFHGSAAEGERRMAKLLDRATLPACWTGTQPAPAAPPLQPGQSAHGPLLGAAFGQIDAGDLARLVAHSGAVALRLAPGRLFLLEDGEPGDAAPFLADAGDPLLGIDACPGAPACASATVGTRPLARALAGRVPAGLHVSGCAKGCARPRSARLTLVGRDGRFDLIRDGSSGDTPRETGLTPADILAKADRL